MLVVRFRRVPGFVSGKSFLVYATFHAYRLRRIAFRMLVGVRYCLKREIIQIVKICPGNQPVWLREILYLRRPVCVRLVLRQVPGYCRNPSVICRSVVWIIFSSVKSPPCIVVGIIRGLIIVFVHVAITLVVLRSFIIAPRASSSRRRVKVLPCITAILVPRCGTP